MFSISKYLGSDRRTIRAQKNVFFSMGIKGFDALTQFLLVPVTLGILNPYEYGIWLTLNSILVWINSFDIGLGNGLRNQLAEAVAKKDQEKARALVSTAFCMIAVIMLLIFAIGSVIFLNCNWYSILNADPVTVPNLTKVVYVSFALFCVNFMVKFVGNVYLAMQMPAVNNFLVTTGHLLSLLLIWVLSMSTDGSLFYVALVFSLSPVVIYTIAYPITFHYVYKQLKPSFKLFHKEYLKSLFNVGILFFVLQVSGVVLFAMSNVVLSNLFGPEHVTPYNITHRYFSIANMLMAIIMSPMWSAVTDAYAKGEIEWIRKSLHKADYIICFLIALVVLMLLISPIVYKIWIGTSVDIPFMLSLLMGLYTIIIISSTAYSYFLNGLGKLRVQTITTLIVALLFLPLNFFLGKEFGVYGVVVSMIFLNLTGAILNRVQINKIVLGTATGLWNK